MKKKKCTRVDLDVEPATVTTKNKAIKWVPDDITDVDNRGVWWS
eukprot:COSAG05_NODE_10110_length_582_cov_1.525880_1_plen_43_part_01